MTARRFLLTWITATVSFIALHLFSHQVLLKSYFGPHLDHLRKPDAAMAVGALILLGLPFLFTVLYMQRKESSRPLLDALLFGATVGLMFVFPLGTVMVVYAGADPSFLLVDIPLHAVEEALVAIPMCAARYGLGALKPSAKAARAVPAAAVLCLGALGFNGCAAKQIVQRTDTCAASHARVGESVAIEGEGETRGTATIVDDCTVEVADLHFTDFSGDARIVALTGEGEDDFVVLSNTLANFKSGREEGSTHLVKLPTSTTLDDIQGFAVMCVLGKSTFAAGKLAAR
jgi:hypothetical protein